MNRRTFLTSSAVTAAALPALAAAAEKTPPRVVNKTATAIGAYYLNAHMYTYVPRHIRADMEWMADIGTQYVCVGVVEQDLSAAYENHALIAEEDRDGKRSVLPNLRGTPQGEVISMLLAASTSSRWITG